MYQPSADARFYRGASEIAVDIRNSAFDISPTKMQRQSITELKDTQSEVDYRKIAIDRVGVKNVRYPIRILDKEHETQSTIATVALTVDLPHHYKGTHMSRFIEVLNEHGRVLHVDKIKTIAHELLERLDAQQAHVDFEFPFFLEKRA